MGTVEFGAPKPDNRRTRRMGTRLTTIGREQMLDIKSGLRSVTDRQRWAVRGASLVAKAKATKAVWFPPTPADTGKKAASTAKKSASTAKKASKPTAKKASRAAQKPANGTKKRATARQTKGSTPHVYGPDGGGVFTDPEAAQGAADQMAAQDEGRLEIQPVLPISQGN
jgi:hypothetical protein